MTRFVILDGYTDEPAGFGVPPYIDVYPRYIAGAIWHCVPDAIIDYWTVDEARARIHDFLRSASQARMVVVVAGAVVPGRYLGGSPLTGREAASWFSALRGPVKILAGPVARYGFGNIGGGFVRVLPREVRSVFDYVVVGDPDLFVYRLLSEGEEAADERERWNDTRLMDIFAVKGTAIVEQHPCHGYNLVAELETYRGCPRYLTGGCSFCVTKNYGRPLQRPVEAVVREVEALYRHGVRHFRVGRQADILVYGSPQLGVEEWPKPSPEAIRRLFHGIRCVAPGLYTLHIDNVNPGTIVRHEKESIETLKVIVEYHTPGDVAAMGIETADPRVVKMNNLKVYPEDALKAVRIVNRVGGKRGYNGLPELLPGVNFVLGLIGESRETFRLNIEFLERIMREGLLVRRINVREVLILPGTRMWSHGDWELRRHRRMIKSFKKRVSALSEEFLRRLLPRGSVLRWLYVEGFDERRGVTFARQAGSYPLVAELPCRLDCRGVVDVAVYDYTARSIRALPIPLDPGAPTSILARLLGRGLAVRVKRGIGELRPYVLRGGHVCSGPT